MKVPQQFYSFTKGQRKGIVVLFLLILLVQVVFLVVDSVGFTGRSAPSGEEKEWLALQSQIDSLKAAKQRKSDTIYSFNPNYITDYKGYMLGLSTAQIDRLHAYRKSGKFINNAVDFQIVTGISDSLLAKMSPYFTLRAGIDSDTKKELYNNQVFDAKLIENVEVMDINMAQENDLVKIHGIGPSYAGMIVRRRTDLGAFVSMRQIDDFAELPEDARQNLKRNFSVINTPKPNRLNVNTASLQQLSRFPYFNRDIARSILTQRSMNGKLDKIDELLEIPGFPVDKVEIIALYLDF